MHCVVHTLRETGCPQSPSVYLRGWSGCRWTQQTNPDLEWWFVSLLSLDRKKDTFIISLVSFIVLIFMGNKSKSDSFCNHFKRELHMFCWTVVTVAKIWQLLELIHITLFTSKICSHWLCKCKSVHTTATQCLAVQMNLSTYNSKWNGVQLYRISTCRSALKTVFGSVVHPVIWWFKLLLLSSVASV